MNLLKETIRDIGFYGHTQEEIIFIGSEESGYSCTWEEFEKIADFEYDSGYGAPEVATDLIIVFSDGSKMWRYEYDGADSWKYFKTFVEPKNKKKIISLKAGLWETVEEIHEKLSRNQRKTNGTTRF